MPGARLTREDREHIAAGLADGLDYAEIARRLGRPTSTVSREVGRNLRQGTYRAAEAHQTRRRPIRAARPRPGGPGSQATQAPSVETRSAADSSQATQASSVETRSAADGSQATQASSVETRSAADGFANRFAALMVESGLNRMAARVLTAIVTTDAGALTAAELVARLRVSPASVSKSIAYLEALDIVRRERPAGRRERYVIDDDVWLRTGLTSARAHAKWAAAAREGAALHGPDTPAGVRLERMGRFFDDLSRGMTLDYDPAVADDMLTVIAALVHAAAPRDAAELALTLDWPRPRVEAALALAADRPDFADPVSPQPEPDGRYRAVANPRRRELFRP
ncbi:MarR family transcriptional regulator [Dactylosporangium sp. NPDC051541]|uniref:GbsR/MarR family transcriptional regulator n=1 Tax=Dactylosporangium sp. NPDC051541 TaxID=3363977 RepID=UPI0037AE7C42